MANDYQRIERAIAYIQQHLVQQPVLDEVARHIGLSPFHFQRLFRQWAGVSPKQFLEYLTVEHAKLKLRNASNILDTSYALGLSSPARLHDQFITMEAVTPGQYRNGGDGLLISYGVHNCPLGGLFLAMTPRGICKVSFLASGDISRELSELQKTWPHARLLHDDAQVRDKARALISAINSGDTQPLHLVVKGSNFQVKVWQAMLKIPYGSLVSYLELARQAGYPHAVRAAASAIAANPIAFLIPCHRVLRKTGQFGKYHWGEDKKRLLIAYEAARLEYRRGATERHFNNHDAQAISSDKKRSDKTD